MSWWADDDADDDGMTLRRWPRRWGWCRLSAAEGPPRWLRWCTRDITPTCAGHFSRLFSFSLITTLFLMPMKHYLFFEDKHFIDDYFAQGPYHCIFTKWCTFLCIDADWLISPMMISDVLRLRVFSIVMWPEHLWLQMRSMCETFLSLRPTFRLMGRCIVAAVSRPIADFHGADDWWGGWLMPGMGLMGPPTWPADDDDDALDWLMITDDDCRDWCKMIFADADFSAMMKYYADYAIIYIDDADFGKDVADDTTFSSCRRLMSFHYDEDAAPAADYDDTLLHADWLISDGRLISRWLMPKWGASRGLQRIDLDDDADAVRLIIFWWWCSWWGAGDIILFFFSSAEIFQFRLMMPMSRYADADYADDGRRDCRV